MWRQQRIRARDIRAIIFCLVSIPMVAVVAYALVASFSVKSWFPVLAATGAYTAWLLTRPRMIRVIQRLRGKSIREWTGYYDD